MHTWDDRYVTMVRGDTMSFGIEIDGLEGDLDTATFTCRKSDTESPVFVKTIGDGITKAGDGQYVVRIPPSDTKGLEIGKYYYDLELGKNGDVFTILRGVLELERDVTR